jgi:hypothetical protein
MWNSYSGILLALALLVSPPCLLCLLLWLFTGRELSPKNSRTTGARMKNEGSRKNLGFEGGCHGCHRTADIHNHNVPLGAMTSYLMVVPAGV